MTKTISMSPGDRSLGWLMPDEEQPMTELPARVVERCRAAYFVGSCRTGTEFEGTRPAADVAEEAVGDDGLLYNDGPMIAAAIRARSSTANPPATQGETR